MTTFAHVFEAKVLDPQQDPTLEAYAARYNGAPILAWALAGHTFKQVTDNDTNGDAIAHGATDNGDGTYTNPPKPAEVIVEV